jgi:hypothetical protein
MSSLTRRTLPFAIGALALFALAACATTGGAPSKEDMLAAAGFRIKPADTPAKAASLQQLPQRRFIHKQVKDQVLTLYADATGCKCLYVGDQQAFQSYQQAAIANHIAEENEAAADAQNEAAMMNSFGWEPWGVETWGWGPW